MQGGKMRGTIPFKGITLFFMLFLLAVNPIKTHAAAPSIVSFNSFGGTPVNKDNSQDIMYLIQPGESLSFTAACSEAADFEWQVNKAVIKTVTAQTTDTLFWNVPNEKGIWEIHLKISNVNGETHQEWVVSTLDINEAPDIFDNFSDKKIAGRIGTDPWGRSLPVWTVEGGGFDSTRGYLWPTAVTTYHANLSTPTTITRGTWIYRYKYLNGTTPLWVSGNYYLTGILSQYLNPQTETGYNALHKGLFLSNPPDGHWWVGSFLAAPRVYYSGYIINMIGSQIYQAPAQRDKIAGTEWHEIVFIKDEQDYVYSYLDGEFVRWSTDIIDDMTSNRFLLDFLDCDASDPVFAYPIVVDDVRIYKDRYLPPRSNARQNCR
jgi:hypothetical protein